MDKALYGFLLFILISEILVILYILFAPIRVDMEEFYRKETPTEGEDNETQIIKDGKNR